MAADTVLITGVSGFVARHCAITFLNAGFAVRGTLRDASRADAVCRSLAAHADVTGLEFTECELLADAGWRDAAAGCAAIIHVASPVGVRQPKDEGDFVRPAVEGTLRLMRAAVEAGVPRFVHTSSISAIHHGHGTKSHFDANDWVDLDGPGITPYVKSKTLSERAARAVADDHPDLHYSSVNPGFIFGPALDDDLSPSVEMIRMFLRGRYPGAPRLNFPSVDVRDVAEAHLRAATSDVPRGGRYITVADSIWMIDMTRGLRHRLGAPARRCPRRGLPNWAARLIALVDAPAASVVAELDRELIFDTTPSQEDLGLRFIPGMDAVEATAHSLIGLGLA